MTLHSIGPFTLDTRTLLLLREGEIVKIPMKTVEVLLALLNRQGEIATKDELLKAPARRVGRRQHLQQILRGGRHAGRRWRRAQQP